MNENYLVPPYPSPPFVMVFPVPFDILRTKTIRCLRPRQRGHWEFEAQREATNSIELQLWQPDLGKLGTLTIESNDAHHSEIHAALPPFPTERRWTDEEKKAIKLPKPERYAAIAVVQARIKNEAEELYQKRRDILEAAIEKCFTCLRHEDIWPSAPAMGDGDTGVTVQAGGDLVDVDPETARLAAAANRWGVQPETVVLWEQIAQLKCIPLTHAKIIERLSLTESNFKYHWKKMKKTGFWGSYPQDYP